MIFDNELSYWNWHAKYRYDDEHPLQTFIRTAKDVAMVNHTHYNEELTQVDVLTDDFVKLILKLEPVGDVEPKINIHSKATGFDPEQELYYEDIHGQVFKPVGLKFTPGGRITANAGTGFEGTTLMNCYIGSPVKSATVQYKMTHPILEDLLVKYESEETSDNLMNIFLSVAELAETLKSEGGYGISFGFIRPRSTLIDGVGIRHPGVVSYMEIWDKVSEIIVRGDGDGYEDNIKNLLQEDVTGIKKVEKNQIRKGAMMGVLPVWHPDIEEFVRAKRTKGKLTKFNISVAVDDAFMRAVRDDSTYNLEFKGKVYKVVRAKELYDLIMKSTYNFADPGVLFLDNMNRGNPIIYLAPVSATNPCVAKGTKVSTEFGWEPVEDVRVGDLIQTVHGFAPVTSIECHKNYPVSKVTFSDGSSLRVTQGHIFHTKTDIDQELWDTDTRLEDLEIGTYVRREEPRFLYPEGMEPMEYISIESIEPDGFDDVYDLYEEESDTWNTEGIVSRGCGEIGGSSHFDSEKKYEPYLQKWIDTFKGEEISGITTVCLLGSHNLAMYVGEDRAFDFDLYTQDIETAALFLENINDIGNAPLDHYQRALTDVRQYGMGVNGLGSTLLMMGIEYGGTESVKFVEKISRIKQNQCWLMSALLAAKRGPAPAYTKQFLETEWFNNVDLDTNIKDLINQYGVRNLKVTTNPPLGNSSVICNNISNSGEPSSWFEYDRTTILDEWPAGLNLEVLKNSFTKTTIAGEEVYTGRFKDLNLLYEPLNRGLCKITKVYDFGYKWVKDRFPDELNHSYMIDSSTLSVKAHLDIQAAMQRHVDQSISKTIIVPNEFPYEDFKDIYMEAWKLGLNGCTTYRVGTLGSVISQSESEDSPQKSKLDLLVECEAINANTNMTDEGVIINSVKLPDSYMMDEMTVVRREGNKYYMAFSFLPNDVEKKHPIAFWILSNTFKKGEYVSMRRAIKSLYELMISEGVDPKLVEQHEGKVGDDNWSGKLGKAISMCLRHNIDLMKIIDKMEGIEGDNISTTLTAVRKFIKARIEDGTRTNRTCFSCGSQNVVYEAGCDKCLDCGSSGCG